VDHPLGGVYRICLEDKVMFKDIKERVVLSNQGDRSMIAHFERITRPAPLIAHETTRFASSEITICCYLMQKRKKKHKKIC
jgi:hypothetical protein